MALATAAQIRVYLRSLQGTAEDSTLDSMISRFDAIGASWCGLPSASVSTSPTFEDVTITQYIDGPGGQELHTARPIQSVTSIYDSTDRTYAAADLVASGDYTLYGDEGLIRLDDDSAHGAWSTTTRAIKLTAVIGFATVPAAITHACGLQVAFWYQNRETAGRRSVSQGGGSVSLTDSGLSLLPEVKEALAPFRLTHGWIS